MLGLHYKRRRVPPSSAARVGGTLEADSVPTIRGFDSRRAVRTISPSCPSRRHHESVHTGHMSSLRGRHATPKLKMSERLTQPFS